MTLVETEMIVESVLMIFSARITDSGVYKCSFDNMAGGIERIINLKTISTYENIKNAIEERKVLI